MFHHHNQSTNPSLFPEHEHLNCPRCDSTNTKFCYYNNYNLSQPRHYCKNCRRYWTKGGTLRKIPVGGAIRKKRSSSSSDDNKIPATNSSPAATVPPAQMKAEPSQILRFGNGQRLSLRDGSEDGGLIPATTVSGAGENNININININNNDNDNKNKNTTAGWTNLSIFTSGSNFN